MARYFGLHPMSYLILGIASIPLTAGIFYYYFSPMLFIAWLTGVLHGIAANEIWFSFMDKNFKIWKKTILKRHYHKVFRKMEPMLLSYLIMSAIGFLIFNFFGSIPFISLILGICLTGLFYYKEEGKFYRKLMKK